MKIYVYLLNKMMVWR